MSHRYIIYILLGLALIRGLIYASLIPPWQAPDEPAHFERVRAALIAEEWQANSNGDPNWYLDLRDSLYINKFPDYFIDNMVNDPAAPLRAYIDLYPDIYQGTYANRPTYAFIGLPLFLAPAADVTLQLYLVRLNIVLMNTAIILLAYLIPRTIFPNKPFLYLGVPILILFNPQHTHLLSTINNGNLAELLVALCLFLIARGICYGFKWQNVLLIIGVALIAMWTKATAYFLLVTLSATLITYLWRFRRYWYWGLAASAVLAGVLLYLAPPRFKTLIVQASHNLRLGNFELEFLVLRSIFRSFWALPGWLAVLLDAIWYQIIFILCLLAVLGLLISIISKRRLIFSKKYWPQTQILAIFAVSIITAISAQLGWQIITGTQYYTQARSLFPLIIPIYIFLLLGWQQLIPTGYQKSALLGLSLAFFLFDSLVLLYYILPFFYS